MSKQEYKHHISMAQIEEDTHSPLRQELLSCIVCHGLVADPVRCTNKDCEQMFCRLCADSIKEHNLACPRCRKQSFEIGPLGRVAKRMLELQYVFCACNKGMLYEELVDHVALCADKCMKCPLGCLTDIKLSNAAEHYEQCLKVLA